MAPSDGNHQVKSRTIVFINRSSNGGSAKSEAVIVYAEACLYRYIVVFMQLNLQSWLLSPTSRTYDHSEKTVNYLAISIRHVCSMYMLVGARNTGAVSLSSVFFFVCFRYRFFLKYDSIVCYFQRSTRFTQTPLLI